MACENCENQALEDATEHIRKANKTHELKKIAIICGSCLFGLLLICATIFGCYTVKKQQETILEQQYALNMQYASLMEYVAGAEITTTETTQSVEGDSATINNGSYEQYNDNAVNGGGE